MGKLIAAARKKTGDGPLDQWWWPDAATIKTALGAEAEKVNNALAKAIEWVRSWRWYQGKPTSD